MKRELCPYCGLDAGTGPYAHLKPALCILALKDHARVNRQRVLLFIQDHLEEVHNHIGGVIGYKLNLNPCETEQLLKEIEE